MNKVIIGLSGFMMLGLIMAMFFYENVDKVKPPKQNTGDPSHVQQQLQPTYVDDHIGYSLQNDELNITFNEGNDWITVPIEIDQLFNGRYSGNRQSLIKHSYIISKEQISFLYLDEPIRNEGRNRLVVTYSFDQGNTWEDTIVAEPHPAIGFRKVNFLNEQFGYVIVSGERVVGQEASYIYTTNNSGEHWELINHPDTMSLVYNGGFIDELTGFLSVGSINPSIPELHVTQDGGNTWSESIINVPTEFSENFLIAEMPFKEADHVALLVNQGPNGDYKGGRVKAKFISEDNGMNWNFVEEVEADE